jgi:hypothetical protein
MPDPIMPPGNQPPLSHAMAQNPPKRVSMLAVFSLVLSLLAIPAIFVCIGLPMAVVALVLGIAALVVTSRSGRVKGGGMAWAGVIVSGLTLTGTVVMMAFFAKEGAKERANQPTLDKAEALIIGDSQGTVHGNSDAARAIAKDYQELLDKLDEEFFEWEGEKPKLMLSGGKFICYCQLEEGSCAFLVHVPGYRKYDDKAKEALNEMAWMAAQMVAEAHPDEVTSGDKLAVGLKGVVLYGAILTGKAGSEMDPRKGSDDKVLLPFFPNPEKALESAE